jgi:hypothetical protein
MSSMGELHQSGADDACPKKDYGCECGRDHATGFNIVTDASKHSARGIELAGTWKRPAINKILDASDAAVEKGLLRVYMFQTASEQMSGTSREVNGVGFNNRDDVFATSLAQQIQRNRKMEVPFGRCLSPKQRVWARKLAKRYSKQLTNIANSWGG